MHALNTVFLLTLLVLVLSSLPTTSAWAIAFFEKEDCWGDAYSVHSGDDTYTGYDPECSRPGEDAPNQKCYWNKAWGQIQEKCTIATAPVPKSFFQTKDTMCVVGVYELCTGKDHRFFGDTTPGECNNLKNFKGRKALERDPELAFRCRSVEAYKSMNKPYIVKKLKGHGSFNQTRFTNGTTFANGTDAGTGEDDGGEWGDDDEQWDDDEVSLGEVSEENGDQHDNSGNSVSSGAEQNVTTS